MSNNKNNNKNKSSFGKNASDAISKAVVESEINIRRTTLSIAQNPRTFLMGFLFVAFWLFGYTLFGRTPLSISDADLQTLLSSSNPFVILCSDR